MFNKILIANRGEIAVRIIRACREMGIRTVAVYSEADRDALHTQLADEAVCIGKAQSSDSYLNMERILSATIATKAEAIHPGFGFLSENSRFVEMCEKCNVAFIGPSAEVISRMGNKSEAKNTMRKAKVPVVPGTKEPVYTVEQALEAVKEIGFPVMIKASAGGGGKGMRVAGNEQEFAKLFETAQQESVHSFSDNTMYLERFVENPRHVEVQILADKYGNVVHLGERDCSVQRRHQKMIEESPCIAISDDLRKKMGETAVRAAKAAGYESAGTIEFLLDQSEYNGKCDEQKGNRSGCTVGLCTVGKSLNSVCYHVCVEGSGNHICESCDNDQCKQPAESKEQTTTGFSDILFNQKSHGFSVIFHTGIERSEIGYGSEEDSA